MEIKIRFQYWCCDHGYHGWHEAEIEVEVTKYPGGLVDINLNGVGDVRCNHVIELDAEKKTIRHWEI